MSTQKKRYFCKKCSGSAFCDHNKEKRNCIIYGGNHVCEHNRIKRFCSKCKCKKKNDIIPIYPAPIYPTQHFKYSGLCSAGSSFAGQLSAGPSSAEQDENWDLFSIGSGEYTNDDMEDFLNLSNQ